MRRMRRWVVAAGLGGLVVWAGPLSGREWVVDQRHPSASDQGTGSAQQPLKSISAAVAKAKPGDTVLVKAGVYREELAVAVSGEEGKPIVVQAAPGERVVISGAEVVRNWRKCTKEEAQGNPDWERIWVAEVDWKVTAVFQDDRQMALSRWPTQARTRYPAESGDDRRLVDTKRLIQPAGFWEGGQLTVRNARTTNYDTGTITKYDPATHELVVDAPRRTPIEKGDEYFVKNLVSIISAPGQWAIDTRRSPYTLFIRPFNDADPNKVVIEASRKGTDRLVSWAPGCGHLVFDGLEITRSAGAGIGGRGSESSRGHNVEVRNCIIHHNVDSGVSVSYQADLAVRRCVVARNGHHGISVGFTKGAVIEENEVEGNAEDGVVVGWYSHRVNLVRNLIHGQWALRHPDGVQTFAEVKEFLVKDNLVLNNGQCWQCANTGPAQVVNNVWVGARGACLNLSPRSLETRSGTFPPNVDMELTHNTLVFNGSDNMTILSSFKVYGNIMGSGWRDPKGGFECDRNLYFGDNPERLLEGYRASGADKHSIAGQPKFRSAPAGVYWVDERRLADCQPGKLFLRRVPAGAFAVGDRIELNWDGKLRKVTEVGQGYIAFEPALEEVHPWGWDVVAHWKDKTEPLLDLRLADDSPGKGMVDGKDVGATIDIPAYLRRDFDGDGKRDLPAVPESVWYPVHTLDE